MIMQKAKKLPRIVPMLKSCVNSYKIKLFKSFLIYKFEEYPFLKANGSIIP